jgi:hypothetical protein
MICRVIVRLWQEEAAHAVIGALCVVECGGKR